MQKGNSKNNDIAGNVHKLEMSKATRKSTGEPHTPQTVGQRTDIGTDLNLQGGAG